MGFLKSFIIAFSMYSKVPMPHVNWDKDSSKYIFVFFPFVGALVGILSSLFFILAERLSLGNLLRGVILTIIPIIVTGGIHLDGYTDVSDAISSYGDREKRLEILKDPHVGAFGQIRLATILLLQFGLFTEIRGIEEMLIISAGYVLSRALSGLAAITFKNAKGEGTLFSFSTPSNRMCTLILILVIIVLTGVFTVSKGTYSGVLMLLACGLSFLFYYFYSKRIFGGITGDLAGWFLIICETAMLSAVVLAEKTAGLFI